MLDLFVVFLPNHWCEMQVWQQVCCFASLQLLLWHGCAGAHSSVKLVYACGQTYTKRYRRRNLETAQLRSTKWRPWCDTCLLPTRCVKAYHTIFSLFWKTYVWLFWVLTFGFHFVGLEGQIFIRWNLDFSFFRIPICFFSFLIFVFYVMYGLKLWPKVYI